MCEHVQAGWVAARGLGQVTAPAFADGRNEAVDVRQADLVWFIRGPDHAALEHEPGSVVGGVAHVLALARIAG